jgi:hypothetical protein
MRAPRRSKHENFSAWNTAYAANACRTSQAGKGIDKSLFEPHRNRNVFVLYCIDTTF